MSDPDEAVTSWFKALPSKMQRQLARDLKDIADNLAADIKAAAPVKTGKLRDSVRVRRGRNTLELYVEAGGADTTTACLVGLESGRATVEAIYD